LRGLVSEGTACRVVEEDEKERNAIVRGNRGLEDDLAIMESIVNSELDWGKLRHTTMALVIQMWEIR